MFRTRIPPCHAPHAPFSEPVQAMFRTHIPLFHEPTPPFANPYKPYFEPTYPLVMNLQPRFFNPHNPVARFFLRGKLSTGCLLSFSLSSEHFVRKFRCFRCKLPYFHAESSDVFLLVSDSGADHEPASEQLRAGKCGKEYSLPCCLPFGLWACGSASAAETIGYPL